MTHGPFGLSDEQIAANFERMRQGAAPAIVEASQVIGLELYALQLEGIIMALEYKLRGKKPL